MADEVFTGGEMIENLYQYPSVLRRQIAAPLLSEREQYLAHLLDQGMNKGGVAVTARFLRHIVKAMELTTLRPVVLADIDAGYQRWLTEPSCHRKIDNQRSLVIFRGTASGWFRFHKVFCESTPDAVDLIANDFEEFLLSNRGYLHPTSTSYATRIKRFLRWVLTRCNDLSSVSLSDVDAFLAMKRADGCATQTLISYCTTLRMFFQYAEIRGHNRMKLARSIFSPISKGRISEPKGPAWKDVRRLIKTCSRTNASDVRAEAIILLCSIYGFRGIEVRNFTLEDFDWSAETLIVRRAKRGKVQQFPIQYEVGEAILRYLQHFRPKCTCRNLFVSLLPPYRPMNCSGFWDVVTKRMSKIGLGGKHFGPHSLRHACATELLRRGSSLKDIADFLGHSDLSSVSIYAKFDVRSLRQVATFSLAGVK